MNVEGFKKIQTRLDALTRSGWLLLGLAILQFFIPPYASKGYNPAEIPNVIFNVLDQALVYDLSSLYPVFQIIPIILIILLIFLKNKVARIFNAYVAVSYILFAFLQNIAITEKYGLGIVINNLLMFLVVAFVWIWEAVVRENDFTPHRQPIWKYWVIPLAFVAFWYPANLQTGRPDFNPLYLLTGPSGLAFCLMTPVYLAILTMYYPRVNVVTLRVTSLVGIILGLYNMWGNFLVDPGVNWWNGVLHIPLLTISLYGLVLSIRKRHPSTRYNNLMKRFEVIDTPLIRASVPLVET